MTGFKGIKCWSRRAAGTLITTALLFGQGAAVAQTYPSKPIRIVAAEAGSPNDIVGRMIASGMSASLGQPVLMDNKGGGGVVQPDIVSKAAPDGYTLMFIGTQLWILQYMRTEIPYRMSDFRPITIATTSPAFLVVHPSVPATSVKELIALARAKPGQLNFASGSAGTVTQLAPELFKSMTGVNMVGIPYKGGASAVAAVVSGEVQLMFATPAGILPMIRAGKVKALAVTSPKPSELLPDLPTVAATGLPDFEAAAVIGMLAPAKVSDAIIGRLHQEIVRTLQKPELKEKVTSLGLEIVGNTPAEFAAKIKSDMDRLGTVIKNAGIRDE